MLENNTMSLPCCNDVLHIRRKPSRIHPAVCIAIHQVTGNPKLQFPEVQMIRPKIVLDNSGLGVVSHILVRRRAGYAICWSLVCFLVVIHKNLVFPTVKP